MTISRITFFNHGICNEQISSLSQKTVLHVMYLPIVLLASENICNGPRQFQLNGYGMRLMVTRS